MTVVLGGGVGALACELADQAMHPKRLLAGRREQRVAQQQLNRLVDLLLCDADIGVVAERFKQLARDALGGQMRAYSQQLVRDGLLGDLLKGQLPDRRDGVLIAQGSAGREQLGRALAQALPVGVERYRALVGIRGGLLEGQRQVPQSLGDLAE